MDKNTKKYAADYTLQELLVVAAAREIKDKEVVFVGVGIPCLGALVAKLTHAPNVILAVESGCIGPTPYRLMLGIGDNSCGENAIYVTSLWRHFPINSVDTSMWECLEGSDRQIRKSKQHGHFWRR